MKSARVVLSKDSFVHPAWADGTSQCGILHRGASRATTLCGTEPPIEAVSWPLPRQFAFRLVSHTQATSGFDEEQLDPGSCCRHRPTGCTDFSPVESWS